MPRGFACSWSSSSSPILLSQVFPLFDEGTQRQRTGQPSCVLWHELYVTLTGVGVLVGFWGDVGVLAMPHLLLGH